MRVFRFEKNEVCRLETIKRREMYLAAPESFNDLDDCRIQGIWSPDFEFQRHEKLMKCVEILHPETSDNYFLLPKNVISNLKEIINHFSSPDGCFDDEFHRLLHRNANVQIIRKFLRESTGVCCFFKDEPKHPLMWAHYANSHTGFCVEYEVDEIVAPLFEVNYASILPSPSINELILCPEESFLRILTTKTLEWSYEKEVRCISLNALLSGESGKSIPLPSSMKPVRLIKGAKFAHSKNEELLHSLELETVLYKNM